jgi:hypothetical protein
MSAPYAGMQYYKAFDSQLKEHMGKGYSFSTFHATLGVAKSDVEGWLASQESFAYAKEIGEGLRRKALEGLLLSKLISLDVFKHLTETEAEDMESFDDIVIEQARDRFA